MDNNETTPKEKEVEENKADKKENWFVTKKKNNPTIPLFLFLILVYSIGAYCLFEKSGESLERGKQAVIENQAIHIHRIDSVFKAIQKRSKADFQKNHEELDKIIKDSLTARIPYVTYWEEQKIRKYVKSIIDISVSETAYHDWVKQIDDALINKEASRILEDSKCLFNLEFDRIQHEYETLSLWAGILTIVFLIFSFYSLFKAEDLVKQGKTGVKELNGLKEKGEEIQKACSKQNEEIQESLKNSKCSLNILDEKINSLDSSFSDKLSEANKILEDAKDIKGVIFEEYLTIQQDFKKIKEKLNSAKLDSFWDKTKDIKEQIQKDDLNKIKESMKSYLGIEDFSDSEDSSGNEEPDENKNDVQ